MTPFAVQVLRGGDLRPVVWVLSQPLFWGVLGVVVGPYLFFRGFGDLRLKRHIMNVPRCTIRAAALGPIEVSGKAIGPYTLVAPITKTDCLCYWVVNESDSLGPFSTTTRKMCAPLFLDDGTGTLMISPHALDIRLYPSSVGPVQEYIVRPGDPIFVLGSLEENPWATKSEDDELSRIGPGFVSEDEADMLRREAFPFLDATLPAGEGTDSNRKFDLHPSTILMKSKGPFLISTDSQREVLSNLSWKSFLYIWGGPLGTLWGLWELIFVRPGLIGSPFN